MPELASTFYRPFYEQQAAWRLRLGNLIPTQSWLDLQGNGHDRGFMVAGAAKADLLADLAAAVGKGIEKGTTLEEFRRDFREIVARHGWTGWAGEGSVQGEAWRTRTIYRTNVLTTYAAGRRAQLIAGNFKYWVYRHSGSEHPRLHHLALNGIPLPPDHPFWQTHFAPNGWGCGCEVYGAHTLAGIIRVGGDPDKRLPDGWNVRDSRGQLPGIQKGWDHAPGATVSDTIIALDGKLPRLPAAIGSRMFDSWDARSVHKISGAFSGFVDRAMTQPGQQDPQIIGALKASWVDAAARNNIEIDSAEISITDAQARAFSRPGDDADLAWFRQLPLHLRRPRAVFLGAGEKDPVFYLVFEVPGTSDFLLVEITAPLKNGTGDMNAVRAGRRVSASDLDGILARGVQLIDGGL